MYYYVRTRRLLRTKRIGLIDFGKRDYSTLIELVTGRTAVGTTQAFHLHTCTASELVRTAETIILG
jgi:hypothetical protein